MAASTIEFEDSYSLTSLSSLSVRYDAAVEPCKAKNSCAADSNISVSWTELACPTGFLELDAQPSESTLRPTGSASTHASPSSFKDGKSTLACPDRLAGYESLSTCYVAPCALSSRDDAGQAACSECNGNQCPAYLSQFSAIENSAHPYRYFSNTTMLLPQDTPTNFGKFFLFHFHKCSILFILRLKFQAYLLLSIFSQF